MYPFREGSFAVRNGWYVAAFANQVGRELVSRTILGQPVVVFRKEDGEAVAVGGRCPHRHFPLGQGCLKGDTVVCGYHGIAFGADGQCVDIPSQDFTPRTYRIPTFPLVEHGMWLFIWMGDPARADRSMLPGLEEIGFVGEGVVARPFYFHEVVCRYQLLNDNLLDLTHLAFLHGTSIGTLENASTPEEISHRPGFLSSRRHSKNAPSPPVSEELGRSYTGPIDRTTGMDFYLPGFHAGIGDARYPDGHERAGDILIANRVYHAVTPSTPGSCYYFFGMSSTNEADLDQLEPYLAKVLDEDIFASVEIEKMIRLVGENVPELMIKSDTNAVLARRMLQAMMDEEAADAAPPAHNDIKQDAGRVE